MSAPILSSITVTIEHTYADGRQVSQSVALADDAAVTPCSVAGTVVPRVRIVGSVAAFHTSSAAGMVSTTWTPPRSPDLAICTWCRSCSGDDEPNVSLWDDQHCDDAGLPCSAAAPSNHYCTQVDEHTGPHIARTGGELLAVWSA